MHERTRNRGDLQTPKVRLEYANHGFYFSGVKNWNDIPNNNNPSLVLIRFYRVSFELSTGPKHDPLVEQQ